ncbi:MAG: hypothetical protein HOP20_05450 [Sulfuriferula sp.]|nr:hypothetical protein [Sulfuriferula sp.]
MLSCKDFSQRVSSGNEHELPLLTRWQMRLHLMLCSSCRNFNRQMQVITRAMRHIAREPERYTQVELSEPARQRIQQKMHAAMRQKNQ